MRGDIVILSLRGDHGKPRPFLVIQSDLFADTPLLAVVPLTSLGEATPLVRVLIEATPATGLRVASFAMLDRTTTAPREQIAQVIGRANDATMIAVNRALMVFLGLA
jgi:mRNA interferase MazF